MLSRGVRGYINCPAFAEPPTTLIVWTKDGEVVDTERPEGGRSTDSRGALIIDKATIDDEGLYYCSAYSPLDDLRTDYPIWVNVKGTSLPGDCRVTRHSVNQSINQSIMQLVTRHMSV